MSWILKLKDSLKIQRCMKYMKKRSFFEIINWSFFYNLRVEAIIKRWEAIRLRIELKVDQCSLKPLLSLTDDKPTNQEDEKPAKVAKIDVTPIKTTVDIRAKKQPAKTYIRIGSKNFKSSTVEDLDNVEIDVSEEVIAPEIEQNVQADINFDELFQKDEDVAGNSTASSKREAEGTPKVIPRKKVKKIKSFTSPLSCAIKRRADSSDEEMEESGTTNGSSVTSTWTHIQISAKLQEIRVAVNWVKYRLVSDILIVCSETVAQCIGIFRLLSDIYGGAFCENN